MGGLLQVIKLRAIKRYIFKIMVVNISLNTFLGRKIP